MENVIIRNIKKMNELLDFYTQLSFSNSYVLETENGQYDYQEYSTLNEQHLYNVTDFLKDDTLNGKVIVLRKNNSDLELKYIIEFQEEKNYGKWKIFVFQYLGKGFYFKN